MLDVKEPRFRPSAKSRRCYHRVISGLERRGDFRFLTLTSSADSPDTCQRSFKTLYMRLKRRNLIYGYIKVPELSKSGKQHLHVLFRGRYVEQALISDWWQEIHHAKVVDIRRVNSSRSPRCIAGYMAKYMAKALFFRYSWSWGWVWKGFVKDWKKTCRLWRHLNDLGMNLPFSECLRWWHLWLIGWEKPDFSQLPAET